MSIQFTLPLLLCGLFTPAYGADPLTAAEFEAYTTGKTLYFNLEGEAYGAEQYLPNRRVQWSFLDGKCDEGDWYPDNRMICFTYDSEPDPQCWTFFKTPDGLVANFENDPTQTTLFTARESTEPMLCPGPDVGV
jgi:hypothetical protein